MRRLIFFFLSVVSMFSCRSRNVYQKGVYREENYQLASISRAGSLTGGSDIEVKIEKRPGIMLAYPNQGLYDRPYSPDIFQGHPHQYFDTNHTAYTNNIEFRRASPVMLHFDEKKFSIEDYEHYTSFFAHEWPKIVQRRNEEYKADWLSAGGKEEDTPSPYGFRLIGTAYGSRLSYSRIFVAKEDDGYYLIRVTPEGDITYEKGRNPESASDMHTRFTFNLTSKIQMPGKIVIQHLAPGTMTKEQLLRYKDSAGKSIADYFTLQPENKMQ